MDNNLLCGQSPLWDQNLSWNTTTTPDLTVCFQNTICVWVPCGFFFVTLPYQLYRQSASKEKHIPFNAKNVTKLVIMLILILMYISLLIYDALLELHSYAISHSITAFTYIVIAAMINQDRKNAVRSSGPIFVFWILQTIAITIAYRSHIITVIHYHDAFTANSQRTLPHIIHFGIILAAFPLVVVQFILSCFADNEPKYSLYPDSEDIFREDTSSVLSQYIYHWLYSFIVAGYKKSLTIEDVPHLPPRRRCDQLNSRLTSKWLEEKKKSKRSRTTSHNIYHPSIVSALAKTFWQPFLVGAFMKLVSDVLIFVSPQILNLIISFISSDAPKWKGLVYVLILFTAAELQSIFLSRYFFHMFAVAMEVRSSVIIAIYKKALKLSNEERKKSTVGEIVNLMSIDTQRLLDVIPIVNMMWSAPLQICLALYFLYQILGVSAFAGISFLVLLIPVNSIIAKFINKLQVKNMSLKDDRTKEMNEILNGIKVLKLYAWENPFITNVLKIRSREIDILRKLAFLNAAMILTWNTAPFIVALASFGTFIMLDDKNILTPNTAFVSLSLLNIIRFPLTMLPNMASFVVQAIISINRINKFMRCEELDEHAVSRSKDCPEAIRFKGASFSWAKTPTLKNLNLSVTKGKLIAVVGQVGSGKSSLISALIGEMNKTQGKVSVNGSLAYVPQIAWIRNCSLRNNILMYRRRDDAFYNEILEACALNPDLKVLPAGDDTEIGEKGINLSGGQKQRISLARAVYHDTDIYLLDDPLSAVDAHVGRHIFDKVIGPSGMLSAKTRIFATNGISYLLHCDLIIVMKEGKFHQVGSYDQLIKYDGAFNELITQFTTQDEASDEKPDIDVTNFDDLPSKHALNLSSSMSVGGPSTTSSRKGSVALSDKFDKSPVGTSLEVPKNVQRRASSIIVHERRASMMMEKDDSLQVDDGSAQIVDKSKLVQSEDVVTGSVNWSIYTEYIKTIGIVLSLLIMVARVAGEAFAASANIWLSEWSEDSILLNHTAYTKQRDYRLGVYGGFGLAQAVAMAFASIGLAHGTMLSATALHSRLLRSIMRSPMSFFDITPIGRIINRFSKDINTMDVNLVWNINDFSGAFLQIMATIVIISMQTPIFLLVMVPLAFLYLYIQRVYIASSRQLRRLESTTRSPIYTHFSESLTGSSSIRAYGMYDHFLLETNDKVNVNQRCYFPTVMTNRWLSVRLEFIGNCMILFAALFAVLGRDTIDPGAVGLSISYAMSITSELMWMVRQSSELEMNMVSVERIQEYCNVPSEAVWEHEGEKTNLDQWPRAGAITLTDYSTRYRPGLDLVLKNVSCEISPGEKIGICGRTGAGKSSLTLALFRIIEANRGSILIDGVDISKIGLHTLRSKLTIIPQDPVLFSGTLRHNLDPFNKFSDEQVWKALENSHLKSFVTSHNDRLEYVISEGGENLSVGQRQLICLARAILRKTKILVLDEATAAIDLQTDELVQQTIRVQFEDSTVITIAHRLNTIMDNTRVMVLKNGEIAEFDSPDNLLKDNLTNFYEMAKDAGIIKA